MTEFRLDIFYNGTHESVYSDYCDDLIDHGFEQLQKGAKSAYILSRIGNSKLYDVECQLTI